MKIVQADIEPLKMGRLKSGELRAISCRITLTYADGKTHHHHADTKHGGIMEAYNRAQKMIKESQCTN